MTIETEDLTAFGIMLCDQSIVVGKLHTPAPAHDKAVTKELNGTTGLGEIVTTRVEHIATTSDLARIRIDIQTQYPCALWIMAVAVVKNG